MLCQEKVMCPHVPQDVSNLELSTEYTQEPARLPTTDLPHGITRRKGPVLQALIKNKSTEWHCCATDPKAKLGAGAAEL